MRGKSNLQRVIYYAHTSIKIVQFSKSESSKEYVEKMIQFLGTRKIFSLNTSDGLPQYTR